MIRSLSTLTIALSMLFAVGCWDSGEACDGDVEVTCDDDGVCTCASGPNAGDTCTEDTENDSAGLDDCEVLCCDESGWF